jgi:hypothetical protein
MTMRQLKVQVVDEDGDMIYDDDVTVDDGPDIAMGRAAIREAGINF